MGIVYSFLVGLLLACAFKSLQQTTNVYVLLSGASFGMALIIYRSLVMDAARKFWKLPSPNCHTVGWNDKDNNNGY